MSNSIIELFGLEAGNEVINSCELTNGNGMQLKVITYGATVTSLKIPLKSGELLDVVLGFDTLDAYMKSFDLESAPYFGCTVGRYAGRISEGTFNLNGNSFHLNKNDNDHHALHGGSVGFSKKIWKIKSKNEGLNPSVTLSYCSPDMEENYPGELSVELTYSLSEEDELIIEYKANTSKDTVVNLTHHSYFNLDGHVSNVLEQELIINAGKKLETTDEMIPTGRFLNTANSCFDFSRAEKCPSKIDATFVLDPDSKLAASLFNKRNNLKMEVFTDQPAVHIYVGGNCFNAIKGKENADYHTTSGICFETQNFPDAPNHDNFPNSILRKEDTFNHKTIYKFESF